MDPHRRRPGLRYGEQRPDRFGHFRGRHHQFPTAAITSPYRPRTGRYRQSSPGPGPTPTVRNTGLPVRVDNGTWSTVAMTLHPHLRRSGGRQPLRPGTGGRPVGQHVHRSVNFTLDITPPVVSITSPAGGFITNSTTVTVDWTGHRFAGRIQGYQYRIDAQWMVRPCPERSPTTSRPLRRTAHGRRPGRRQRRQLAITSVTFRVDTTAPAVSIIIPSQWAIIQLVDGHVSSGRPPTAAPASKATNTTSTARMVLPACGKSHSFTGLGEGDQPSNPGDRQCQPTVR